MSEIVKTFLSDFIKSLIPQLPYYKKILVEKPSYSLKYFVALIFFVNLIFFSLFISKSETRNLSSLKNSIVESLNNYPKDLNIHIKDGVLMTSWDRPYFFWVNYGEKKILALVVDESALPNDVEKYNSLSLLTHSYFILNSKALKIEQKKIPLTSSFITIDKSFIDNFKEFIKNGFPYLVAGFFFFGIFISPVIMSIYMFVLILLSSLVSYSLYELVDKKHNHGKTFQLALHASTLPILAFYTIGFINPFAKNLHIAVFILVLVFTLCALYETYLDQA